MASLPIYQLYAELYDYEPKMWRRFQTLNNTSMARLGYIIMTLFEMQASHLFNFDIPVAENYRKYVDKYINNENKEKVIDYFDMRPELANNRIELQNEDLCRCL